MLERDNSYSGYDPDDKVTRAEMAKFLINYIEAIGSNIKINNECNKAGVAYPTDIYDYSDLTDFMKQLVDRGLTESCPEYNPSDSVTRSEIIRFVYRIE
ncbi:hypothetical protein [Candidatus Albibeggiatoa sp. nov. BB20]|uniref:hypothetical protein n=1 Tax=Candidatus Albibeggiatoa sp. nov. BB20 TaxID=3162723 RepID=UPI0033657C09